MVIYIIIMILSYLIGTKIFIRYDYHGPNSNKIKKYVYKINDKYYRFTPVICICPLNCCVKYK